MFIDLHTHSNRSDGTLSPTELIVLAKKKGLSAISLTDHDTVDGLDEAIEAGKLYDVEVIPGIELAADFTDDNLHILGYYMDYRNEKFLETLTPIKNSREIRNKDMVRKLNALGFDMTVDDLLEASSSTDNAHNVITRAHFAKVLLEKGYISSMQEAFKLYLSPGMPGYSNRIIPSPKEAIQIIHDAGGVAILAHPTLYGLEIGSKLEDLIMELASYGLDGVEALYSLHSSDQTRFLRNIARRNHLIISGGSDFHGGNKPDIDLGVGHGNLKVPYEVLEGIKARAGRNR